ncbi:MAG: D-alanyl-D-alanine carboxypeptidase [Clostridia bacterium]|nr:D-alanyl-D-alanine carboxypeptidase [Clostridia bacterium]
MFKKFLKVIAAGLCLAVILSVPFGGGKVSASADGVAEIAMEQESGKILYGRNVDSKLPMASTTKIMTALIIAEDCDLSEVITVPDIAVGVEGSSIYLKKDEQISVRDLLYGLMLRSGNDAACALAVHHSGSVEKFVDRMNERAKELGADSTHFKNPSGLPDDEHYTTARDLCNIARHAMSNAVMKEVVSTRQYSGDFRHFLNKNKLLLSLDGANGVKTGYTKKAGRCLVSSAERDNMDVVCVVLHCYDMYERSAAIINNCFAKYSLETISADRVFKYKGRHCTLDGDCKILIEKDKDIKFNVCAPNDGNAYAKLEIYCENDLIFSRNLYTIN